MKALNFSIDKDFISLNYEGENLDLHNNYDFTSFKHDKISRTAECVFLKSNGAWVPNTAINVLTIQFDNVSDVFSKPDDEDYPVDYLKSDQTSVDMIGYSYASDEIMEGVTSNISTDELPGMLIVFVTGKALKIVAETAQISINKNYS